MTKDEALKMAIDWLQYSLPLDLSKEQIKFIKSVWNEKERKKAINACKEALAEQPTQEPVAQVNEGMGGIEWFVKPMPDDTLLYTHPKQWQGLSDEDIDEIWGDSSKQGISGVDWLVRFARAIEAKLREKNT
jgi:hypothetical protein